MEVLVKKIIQTQRSSLSKWPCFSFNYPRLPFETVKNLPNTEVSGLESQYWDKVGRFRGWNYEASSCRIRLGS